MSADGGGPGDSRGGSVDFLDAVEVDAATGDALDLGAAPRAPWPVRTRRLVAAGAVLAVAAVFAIVVLTQRSDDDDRPVAQPTPAPTTSSSGSTTPLLVTVGGHDALQPPGGAGFGDASPIVLDPAPDVVAVLRAALPGLRDVHGGRIPVTDGKFGVFLSASYEGHSGAVQVTLYTARAPGTTFGSDQFVSRTRFDTDEFAVRTDVSVFTGSGWWVHVVALGPDDPATVRTGETARLLPLAKNPAVVAP